MGNQTVRKYIIIPEFAPLYAMAKCYGPTHAPLKAPTLTPVDVIGELLKQTGRQKVTIYEVVKEGKKFSRPVQLTSLNYRMPYEDIVKGINLTPIKETVIPAEPVTKTISAPVTEDAPADEMPSSVKEATVSFDEEEVSEEVEASGAQEEEKIEEAPVETPVEEDPLDDLVEKVRETFGDDAVIEESEPVAAEEPEVAAKEEDPYAGMTKAQRKAARRKAAEERAAEAAKEILNLE